MYRDQIQRLKTWVKSRGRRPLVVRGARQVGKTWLVRALTASISRDLFEINFERDLHARDWFASNDPTLIIDEIALATGRDLSPSQALLFLDEIQAAGDVLAKLRWFAEELPELAVVAAGSLLEFTLSDHSFSMPVGRVEYLHLEPMTFPEYLKAHQQTRLLARLKAWQPGEAISPAAHVKAQQWYHRFTMVGGMPAVVAADVAGRNAQQIRQLQADLMSTYRDDFAKYTGRMDSHILDRVLLGATRMLGRKFVAAHVGDGVKHHQVSRAVELLCQARVCTSVVHSAANGLPLGGEVNPRQRKLILLDVGMVHALLGTPSARSFPSWSDLASPVKAQILDQLVGQQLRTLTAGNNSLPRLYYWQREGRRPGEIDYLVQSGTRILPVEIKSGAAGAMKSLHQFMYDKHLTLAVRLDANPPSMQDLALKTTQGNPVRYGLLNLPHYLTWRVLELTESDSR